MQCDPIIYMTTQAGTNNLLDRPPVGFNIWPAHGGLQWVVSWESKQQTTGLSRSHRSGRRAKEPELARVYAAWPTTRRIIGESPPNTQLERTECTLKWMALDSPALAQNNSFGSCCCWLVDVDGACFVGPSECCPSAALAGWWLVQVQRCRVRSEAVWLHTCGEGFESEKF